MKYFELLTSSGAKVLDDTYQNIKMSRKLTFANLQDNGTVNGFVDLNNSFNKGTLRLRTLTLLASELKFCAIAPVESVAGKIMLLYRTDTGVTYFAYRDGIDVSGLEIFTFTKNQSLPSTKFGLEIFDGSSNLIFCSAYKYFRPMSYSVNQYAQYNLVDPAASVKRGIIFPLSLAEKTSAVQFYFYTNLRSNNIPWGYFAFQGNIVLSSYRNIAAPIATCDCSYY